MCFEFDLVCGAGFKIEDRSRKLLQHVDPHRLRPHPQQGRAGLPVHLSLLTVTEADVGISIVVAVDQDLHTQVVQRGPIETHLKDLESVVSPDTVHRQALSQQ